MFMGSRTNKLIRSAGAVAALLALSCKEAVTAMPPPPPATPIVSAACMDPTASVVITDPTNYALTDSFDMQVATLKDNTDLVFDWSKVTVDFFGKPVDPAADIDTVLVSLWQLTPQQIEDELKADDLPLATNKGIITTYPDGTSTQQNLLSFNELGNPLPTEDLWARFNTADPSFMYPQDQFTFLAMAQTGTEPGKNPRMISLFHIDPKATQTKLDFTNDSTRLAYSVDLLKAHPMEVPAAAPGLTIDWSQMTTNSLGNVYTYSQITMAAVAHYKTETLAQLQANFLNLEDIADGWWSGPVVAGASLDLAGLTDSAGGAFPGIDETGVWMAALFCGNCNNPAPWSITILEPCSR